MKKLSYFDFWTLRGEYGKERIRRAILRKKKRKAKKGMCKCGHHRKERPHPCPYNQDIYGDSATLCTCCGWCQNNCAEDI